jgi:hypothetical protein
MRVELQPLFVEESSVLELLRFPLCVSSAIPNELQLGRKSTNDIVVKDQNISNKHCRLVWQPSMGALFVEDCDSTNGIYINNRRMARGELVQLRQNDELALIKLKEHGSGTFPTCVDFY